MKWILLLVTAMCGLEALTLKEAEEIVSEIELDDLRQTVARVVSLGLARLNSDRTV